MKKVDNGDHQHERQNQREDDLLHARADALGRIDDRRTAHAVGKPFRQPPDGRLHAVAYVHGIAARLLIDDQQRGRLFAEGRSDAVGLAAQRHVGHVAQKDLLAGGGGLHDDRRELLGRGDLARHGDRISIGSPFGRRLGAELAGRVDAALREHGRPQFVERHVVVVQQIGLDPDAHGIFAGAHDRDLAHAVDFEQLVLKIDVSVVREEFVVVTAVAVQREDHQKTRHRLLRHHALRDDRRGKQCGRGGDVVLREDRIQIGIGTHVEDYLQHHRTVVGTRRLHVEHVAHAHHALRHGRGHGVVDRLRVGSAVTGGHFHDGRRNVGILFDRKIENRNRAQQHDRQGDADGEDRPADEKSFHRLFIRIDRGSE